MSRAQVTRRTAIEAFGLHQREGFWRRPLQTGKLFAMDALRLPLPPVPSAGAVVVLDGVAWPEESFEVLAFLDVPAAEDARALSDGDPRFLGRFFLYGSGVPRPDHAGKIGLSARLRMRPEIASRAAGGAGHTLVLVPRDANGEPLSAADLRVRTVTLEA